jgi:UDP-N-acetylglucosamine 2-epimerase (non-hydrolysing)
MNPIIDLIAGARPNFMKIAAITSALEEHAGKGGPLRFRLIHTGQHYDARMSENFFTQLGIPKPDINLGSGTQAEQTAGIMTGYEALLLKERPALCLVVGDVTSTMACAISAKKLHIPVAHVEAGIRSGDRNMPEEINRLVTDAIADYFFTTSALANENLRKSGVAEEAIFFVGNTMIDTLLKNIPRLRQPEFWDAEGLKAGQYLVATLHRPSNVDDQANYYNLLKVIADNVENMPVVYPVHPRTRAALAEFAELPSNIVCVDPQPYLEFNYLVKHAKGVITDSGGITEETTVMGVPCMTLRDSTERPETITQGTNELVGTNPDNIVPALKRLYAGEWKSGSIPEMWDGKTGPRIVKCLEEILVT